jgi:hypothetical protein
MTMMMMMMMMMTMMMTMMMMRKREAGPGALLHHLRSLAVRHSPARPRYRKI